MLDVKADLGGLLGPLVVGLVLVLGAWSAVRNSEDGRRGGRRGGRHRAHGHRPDVSIRTSGVRRTRPAPAPMPAPMAGAAAGLLESIPFLEPVRRRRRLRGTARLGTALVLAAAFVAVTLYFLGRAIASWIDSFQPF